MEQLKDRACAPEETIERIRPHLADLGITRLARQTGLDRIGVPCFAAFRPNALTLAASQGKGLCDSTAKVSAVMEAIEFAIAEQPSCEVISLAPEDCPVGALFDIKPLLPIGESVCMALPLDMVRGRRLADGAPMLAPFEAVTLTERRVFARMSQNTNGLASGNNWDEAVRHAICELIERDSETLWSLLPREAQLRTSFDPRELCSSEIEGLITAVERAGLRVRTFDQTTELGVPSVFAVLGPREPAHLHFDFTGGTAAHPSAATATIKAILEAIQSRITQIAGARDDIEPELFSAPASPGFHGTLLGATPLARPPQSIKPEGGVVEFLVERLLAASIDDVAVFVLSDDRLPVTIVRAMSGILETRPANRNWRPGRRALAQLLSRAA